MNPDQAGSVPHHRHQAEFLLIRQDRKIDVCHDHQIIILCQFGGQFLAFVGGAQPRNRIAVNIVRSDAMFIGCENHFIFKAREALDQLNDLARGRLLHDKKYFLMGKLAFFIPCGMGRFQGHSGLINVSAVQFAEYGSNKARQQDAEQ